MKDLPQPEMQAFLDSDFDDMEPPLFLFRCGQVFDHDPASPSKSLDEPVPDELKSSSKSST
jgi:hypothetical protein